MLLIGLAFGALFTFVPLFIRETKVDLIAGWFYTSAAIASFSVRLITGRASDAYGRGLFITGSLVCYTLAMLILATANSSFAFLLAGFLEGAGAGTLLPMTIALLSDRSSAQERGLIFSLGIMGLDLGIAIASPVLGSAADYLGYRGIFTLSTSLSLLALIIFLTQSSKDLPHSLRFALGRERDVYAFQEEKSQK
jgi:MFS family permease